MAVWGFVTFMTWITLLLIDPEMGGLYVLRVCLTCVCVYVCLIHARPEADGLDVVMGRILSSCVLLLTQINTHGYTAIPSGP